MSSATLALSPKPTAISFAERPASGRTTMTGDEPRDKSLACDYPGLIQAKTWTKSLLEKWAVIGVRHQVEPGGASKPLSSSTSASALTSLEYSLTLDRVRILRSDEDDQDRPSDEAYERTVSLLRETARHVGMQFPSAIAATGPGRSVRLLWSSSEKELRLVVGGSAANRSYIYWRSAGRSGVDETIEAGRFAQYLSWIIHNV